MKKIICILLLLIMAISLVSCASTDPTIQYIEKEVLVKQCCGNEGVEYAPIDNINVAIICKTCGRELGELPMAIIEKEVVVEEEVIHWVPIEVIVEKEIIVEVEKPIEIIVEKEVIVEKEIIKEVEVIVERNYPELARLTWSDLDNISDETVFTNVIFRSVSSNYIQCWHNEELNYYRISGKYGVINPPDTTSLSQSGFWVGTIMVEKGKYVDDPPYLLRFINCVLLEEYVTQ